MVIASVIARLQSILGFQFCYIKISKLLSAMLSFLFYHWVQSDAGQILNE
jgi:hypothetical protein